MGGWTRGVTATTLLLIAGCASGPTADTAVESSIVEMLDSTRIRNGKNVTAARYVRDKGACEAGAVQFIAAEQYEALVEDWELGDECVMPRKLGLPAHGLYPVVDRRLKPGSAHVLVRLSAGGEIDLVRAVCASSNGFAEAAEQSVGAMKFEAANCGGQPARAAFLLPLNYDPG